MKKKIVLLILAVTGVIVAIQSVFAFGVSPSPVYIQKLLANTEIESAIEFTRNDTTYEEYLQVTVKGEAANFIRKIAKDPLHFKIGQERHTYPFVVAPGNAAAGTYTAILRFEQTEPPPTQTAAFAASTAIGNNTSSAATKSALEVPVIISITNEVIELWEAGSPQIFDTEVNTPVSFSFNFRNKGNVATKPARVHIAFVEKKNPNEIIHEEDVDISNIPVVQSQNAITISLATKKSLKIGTYLAVIRAYDKKGTVIFESPQLGFRVLPEGSLAQKGEIISLQTNKVSRQYDFGEMMSIEGSFRNEGTVGVKATYVVEIYKNGKRIDILKKEIGFVPVGKEAFSVVEFTPTEVGAYTFKSYFLYGISRTSIKELVVNVGGLGDATVLYILLGIVILVIIFLILLIWLRRKEKESQTTLPPPPASSSLPPTQTPTG